MLDAAEEGELLDDLHFEGQDAWASLLYRQAFLLTLAVAGQLLLPCRAEAVLQRHARSWMAPRGMGTAAAAPAPAALPLQPCLFGMTEPCRRPSGSKRPSTLTPAATGCADGLPAGAGPGASRARRVLGQSRRCSCWKPPWMATRILRPLRQVRWAPAGHASTCRTGCPSARLSRAHLLSADAEWQAWSASHADPGSLGRRHHTVCGRQAERGPSVGGVRDLAGCRGPGRAHGGQRRGQRGRERGRPARLRAGREHRRAPVQAGAAAQPRRPAGGCPPPCLCRVPAQEGVHCGRQTPAS